MSDRPFDKTQGRPNVVLILNDDMGYSDLGCYGGVVPREKIQEIFESGKVAHPATQRKDS